MRRAGAPARPGLAGPPPLPPAGALSRALFSAAQLSAAQLSAAQLSAAMFSAALLGLLACRSGEVSPPPTAGAGNVAAAGAGTQSANLEASRKSSNDGYRPRAAEPWHIPVGPKLAIAPGKGFGPIRFGARLDTIERLIGEPCEEKKEEGGKVTCRYSAQAIDFVLEKGAVVEMRGHRLGRPFKDTPKPDYGIFNGSFENGVAFGMVPAAVRELLGAPKSVRPITGDNPFHTVEVHEYDGFRLEFDRVSPESVVLGGVVLDAPRS